jgi:hypothetical protein
MASGEVADGGDEGPFAGSFLVPRVVRRRMPRLCLMFS